MSKNRSELGPFTIILAHFMPFLACRLDKV
jgi:hypothetical protein